jgi:hypothetical protein
MNTIAVPLALGSPAFGTSLDPTIVAVNLQPLINELCITNIVAAIVGDIVAAAIADISGVAAIDCMVALIVAAIIFCGQGGIALSLGIVDIAPVVAVAACPVGLAWALPVPNTANATTARNAPRLLIRINVVWFRIPIAPLTVGRQKFNGNDLNLSQKFAFL